MKIGLRRDMNLAKIVWILVKQIREQIHAAITVTHEENLLPREAGILLERA